MRPKCKAALDRWNKETGGGDGTAASFVECCAGHRWPVWIFCRDHATNFLLAGSACGRMPQHLQAEAGFEEDGVSPLSSTDEIATKCNGIGHDLEDELGHAKRQRQTLDTALERLSECFDCKDFAVVSLDLKDAMLAKAADCSKKMKDEEVLTTMSPNTKNVHLETLKKKRKEVVEKMK